MVCETSPDSLALGSEWTRSEDDLERCAMMRLGITRFVCLFSGFFRCRAFVALATLDKRRQRRRHAQSSLLFLESALLLCERHRRFANCVCCLARVRSFVFDFDLDFAFAFGLNLALAGWCPARKPVR